MVTTVLLVVVATAVIRILAALGLPGDAVAALALPLSLLPFAYLILLAWRHREEVAQAVAARLRLGAREAPMLAAWPVLATTYLLGLWIVVTWGVLTGQPDVAPKALASLLLLLALPIGAWLVQRPLARFYDVSEAHLAAEAEPPPAVTDEYGDALPVQAAAPASAEGRQHVQRLMRAAWVVLLALAVVLTAWLWGFDPERHVGVGGLALRLLFDVGVVLLLGYVAWALIVRSIAERLEAARSEQGSARAQRMATLLPLLRKFLQVVLVTTVAMVLLSSLGVDIGPLIAGAGVVGLAIGLGAQQTIADILAGVFFLIEDAFHIGDYVEVGELRGTVEGISLRSLKLRHHRGAVHTLPFGQMKSLTNYTRDWALMRLEFRVAPDTDTALVKRIVKGIAKDLEADPEIGGGFIEPLKSQGIRSVEDGAHDDRHQVHHQARRPVHHPARGLPAHPRSLSRARDRARRPRRGGEGRGRRVPPTPRSSAPRPRRRPDRRPRRPRHERSRWRHHARRLPRLRRGPPRAGAAGWRGRRLHPVRQGSVPPPCPKHRARAGPERRRPRPVRRGQPVPAHDHEARRSGCGDDAPEGGHGTLRSGMWGLWPPSSSSLRS